MQLQYNSFPAIARPGTPGDVNDAVILHRVAESRVPFGSALSSAGCAVGVCKVPAAALDVIDANGLALPFLGVAQSAQIVSEYELNQVSQVPEYLPGIMINIIRHGEVWVTCETAVAETDQVFVRVTANGVLVPGLFRNDADIQGGVPTAISLGDRARWLKPSASAGVALLRLEL